MANPAEEPMDVQVIEITPEEAWARLDADAQRYLGISADEFATRYDAGEYDDPDDDTRIMRLAFDLEGMRCNLKSPA